MISLTTLFLICGCYGYSSSLIIDLVARCGMHPILSSVDIYPLKNQSGRLAHGFASVVLVRDFLEIIRGEYEG